MEERLLATSGNVMSLCTCALQHYDQAHRQAEAAAEPAAGGGACSAADITFTATTSASGGWNGSLLSFRARPPSFQPAPICHAASSPCPMCGSLQQPDHPFQLPKGVGGWKNSFYHQPIPKLALSHCRPAGTLLVGSSREFGGFDSDPEPEVVDAIMQRAVRFLPGALCPCARCARCRLIEGR